MPTPAPGHHAATPRHAAPASRQLLAQPAAEAGLAVGSCFLFFLPPLLSFLFLPPVTMDQTEATQIQRRYLLPQ
jgi:hypothetical protein